MISIDAYIHQSRYSMIKQNIYIVLRVRVSVRFNYKSIHVFFSVVMSNCLKTHFINISRCESETVISTSKNRTR